MREEVSKEQLMIRSGIGSIYHKRSLFEFGETGRKLMDLLKSGEMAKSLSEGVGVHFVGEQAYDTSIVFSRALVLLGHGLRVCPIGGIIDDLEVDNQLDPIYSQIKVLTIPQFEDQKEPSPLSAVARSRLEWMLTRRIEAGLPLIIQTDEKFGKTSWWTNRFLKLVASRTVVIEQ